jgi:CubicO group peptidase (beta-lactamase class C family)
MKAANLSLAARASLAMALALAACGDDAAQAVPHAAFAGDAGDASAAAPPPLVPEDASELTAPVLARYGVPAIASVVYRGGVKVAAGVAGTRKVGSGFPATLTDRFAIGEGVHALTATLAAVLASEGRVAWTTTLGDVFPAAPPTYQGATLESLLLQSAGAPAAFPADILAAARHAGTPRALRDGAVAALLARGPEGPAGAVLASAPSVLLAAAILEARGGGAAWEELTRTRVLEPLGLTSCAPGTVASAATTDLDALPWGHVALGPDVVPVVPGSDGEPPVAFAPALGLRCALDDVARLGLVHLRAARGESASLLDPAAFQKLRTPVLGTSAPGWSAVSRAWAGAALALTVGSDEASAHARMWVLPDKDTVLVAATNQGGAAGVKAVDDAIAELVGRFTRP